MVEKGYVIGNSIDTRHHVSLAWGKTWHKRGERGQKIQVDSKCKIKLFG